MRKFLLFSMLLVVFAAVFAGVSALAQQEALTPRPLASVIRGAAKPVSATGAKTLFLITWGGDVATILADTEGMFRAEGVDVRLQLENDFQKQVEAVLAGKTPYLRGTLGMINAAAEVFKKNGIDLVVFYQMTWSAGGDTIDVRSHIKTPKDLCGKTIALQLYGPHMDYIANLLTSAGCPLSGPTAPKFRWFRDLQLPTADTGGKTTDPVTAFQKDPSIDAVMAISPDAMTLTSGGKVGAGTPGSVEGARILLTTKTASRIIADVYAVRSDYFAAHRVEVEKITRVLMRAEEALADMRKQSASAKHRQLLGKSADILLGSPSAVADVEGMLADCEFVGFSGNVAFFTGQGTTRTLETLTAEIQTAFVQTGFLSGNTPIFSAGWDYAGLAQGLKYAANVPAPRSQFDPQKVQAAVEKRIAAEPTQWEEQGTLFVVEITFSPNQSVFAEAQYKKDFGKALSLAQTHGGSLVLVEGHSDPYGILRAKQQGENPLIVRMMEQDAKDLSLKRAQSVLQSFMASAKRAQMALDSSRFVPVGMGITSPKFNPPRTREEWAANRRVRFVIKQIESEPEEFQPIGVPTAGK